MATEAELILKLTDQTAAGFKALQSNFNDLKANAKNTEQQMGQLGKGMKDFGSGLLGGFGIGLGFLTAQKAGQAFASALMVIPNTIGAVAHAILDSTQKVIDLGSRLTDLAAKTGVSVEALQKLKFAGSLVGVSLDTITAATTKMQRALVETPEAFNRIGLSAAALRQMKPEEQLAAISEKLRGIQDPAARAAAGMALLGRGGAEMLPLLTSNLRSVMEEAERLGIVLGQDVVAAADDLGDKIDTLSQVWDGLNNNLGAVVVTSEPLHVLMSGLVEILGDLSKTVSDNRDGLRSFIDQAVVLAAEGLVLMAKAAEITSAAWIELKNVWHIAAMEASNLATVISLGTDVIKGNLSITAAAAIATHTAAENSRALGKAMAEEEAAGRKRHEMLATVTGAFERLRDNVVASVGQTHQSTAAIKGQTVAFGANSEAMKRAKRESEALWNFQIQTARLAQKATEEFFKENERQASENAKQMLANLREQKAALEDWHSFLTEAQAKSDEAFARMLDELRDVADAVFDLGDAFGGALGDVLQFGAGALSVLVNLNDEALRAKTGIEKTTIALQGAAAAFKSGSLTGGAVAGASAGAAFGPLGAGIGAIAGGLLGLFGGAKKAREELVKLKAQVVGSFGSMAEFGKAAARAGVDASKAFSTKDPKEFERITKQVNEALEAQQKRMEGLKTAMSGLELMTKGFAGQMERSGVATAASAAAFGRLGNFAVATFAGLVRETGDVIGALQQMGPSLDTLVKAMGDFGFQASGAFARLLQLRNVIVANEDVANSISGLNQLMKGLGEAGLATGAILLDMGAQARANFDELIARGVDAEAAMSLMQPTLQELWEQHRRLGVEYDANTQALIDQAEQQGLVGENFLSVNEQMLEVLKILVETLGGELPAALRRMGDEAEAQFNRMGQAASSAGSQASGSAPGFEHFEDAPGFASGGVVRASPPFGRLIRAGEDEDEFILNRRQMRGLQGGRGGGGGDVFLDGHKVGKVMQRREEAGTISPKSRLRSAR